MLSQVIFSLLTGLASAVIYSLIQGVYSYFRWSKTRRFFTQNIRNSMMYISYHLMDVFEIHAIYPTEDEEDHLITDEEFIEEIKSQQINEKQYKQIVNIIENAREKIEASRKEALTIPSFSSMDFHAVDNFVHEMNNFLSWYSWMADEVSQREISDSLKEKLIVVIAGSQKNLFPNNFLDNTQNWYRNKLRGRRKKLEDFLNELEAKKLTNQETLSVVPDGHS